MSIITSEAHFRQRVLKYSLKYGVTRASDRFGRSRQAIYEWRAKWDGKSWKSLVEKSHRPHHHPAEHTPEEKEMILRRYPRYKDDMMLLWDSLRKSGYTRSYTSLVRVVRKWVQPEIQKRTARKNKPYARAEYPGQKVQVDVKFVPSYCVTNGRKYYQYTAIDECTRWTYREMYEEHSTYSSAQFLANLVKKCPFSIREIQTDNGTEFTNALLQKNCDHKSLFENMLDRYDIIYHRIRVATPRHNGKVERQHRIDEARFYKKMRMYSLEDGRKQLERYNARSNDIPKICLNFRSPNEVLAEYLAIM
ncbi:MAG: transposase [Ruminococcaceae bacterium]|nr:transposase [Oscillospiraceae bacterium]